MTSRVEDFIQFLQSAPTPYHAAKEIGHRLTQAGFTRLLEEEQWDLAPGKSYFVVRQESLVAAFRIPKKSPLSALLLASHIDSPALKLKPQRDFSPSHDISQLGTEVYGAPLLSTWFDRELAVAGRIVGVDRKGHCLSQLVHIEEAPLLIPSLPLHLDRTVNEKGFIVDRQNHLKPIFSLHPQKGGFEEWLRPYHSFEKWLSLDLFLVPLQKPAFAGVDRELLAAYRLDNLTSAFASLSALIQAAPRTDALQMALFWDHEEIGSVSAVGADSLFSEQLLERIALTLSLEREAYWRLKSRSLCLSIDVAHGFHPNFADKFDLPNTAFLGKGVVFKYNANQKYATSGLSAAPLLHLAEKRKIPYQTCASHSNIPSGSTVGSFLAAHLGIPTVDVGIANWAMHSARETIATKDQETLSRFLQVALEDPVSSCKEQT